MRGSRRLMGQLCFFGAAIFLFLKQLVLGYLLHVPQLKHIIEIETKEKLNRN